MDTRAPARWPYKRKVPYIAFKICVLLMNAIHLWISCIPISKTYIYNSIIFVLRSFDRIFFRWTHLKINVPQMYQKSFENISKRTSLFASKFSPFEGKTNHISLGYSRVNFYHIRKITADLCCFQEYCRHRLLISWASRPALVSTSWPPQPCEQLCNIEFKKMCQ